MVTRNLLLIVVLACLLPYGASLLLCPPGVKSFSLGANSHHYYSCNKEGDDAVMQRCPHNEVYWAAKEKCADVTNIGYSGSKFNGNDLKTYTTPVLGRTTYLGCLFDAKKNEIMAGDSFWTEDTIRKAKKISPTYSSIVYFFAAQSTFDRFSHMDFDASLKLEFLGGLVSVEGSASYLKDSVESENTVAVVMKSHYNTHSETIPTVTTKDFLDVCNLDGPTHVVTSISYGMEANFVFKKTTKSSESKEKISGSLKIAVKSIPSIKIEGSAKVNISGALKEATKNVDVKLFGDFVLDKQPTTYEESIFIFKTLTGHLGEAPEYKNAVKMNMQLTPITRFCDGKAALLVGISNNLLHSVTMMLDEIERTKIKANTLANADCVNNYLPLKNIMTIFVNKLNVFQLKVKSELQTLLPNIRGGGANSSEKDLISMLTEYRKSPFYFHTSESFLKTRSREIGMIDYILSPDKFKGTDVNVLKYEKATDDKILFERRLVVLVKFNILPSTDIVNNFIAGKEVDESKSWFNTPKVIAAMGKEFNSFMKFASANRNAADRGYIVAMYNADKEFINVHAQKDGEVISTNFIFPQQPVEMRQTSNTHNSIRFAVAKPDNIWVTSFLVKYSKYGREETTVEKLFKFTREKTTDVDIIGLSSNEVYQFSMTYVTAMGVSLSSTESNVVTRPCSPATNLRVGEISSTSFSIVWDPPMHYGIAVRVANYEVTITGNGLFTTKIVKDRLAVFENLNIASEYNIAVQVNTYVPTHNGTKQQVLQKSLKSHLRVITSPGTPSLPTLVNVAYHSVNINWKAPTQIAAGATIEDYIVQYVMKNNFGNVTMLGSNLVQPCGKKTSASIKSLTQGTTYGVSVQVVTSLGSSAFSPVLIIKTKFKQTELDELREKVGQEITQSVSKSTNMLKKKVKYLESEMAAEWAKVHEDVDRMKSNIKDEQTEINLLKSNVGVSLHIYYKEYHAILQGIGYGRYSGGAYVKATSTKDCIAACYQRRLRDRTINAAYFIISMKSCMCATGDKGHTSGGNNLHYRFT